MKTMTIKRIGVLSLAKVQGAIMAAMGLIIGVIYGGVLILIGLVASQQQGMGPGAPNPSWFAGAGIVGGLLMMVFLPFFYGVMGFVFGALTAFIYNLAAGSVGGLEIDLEAAYPAEPPTLPQTY